MPLSVGIGFSKEKNALSAAREASLLAKLQIKQEKIDLVFVFTTIHYNGEEILKGIRSIISGAYILGCSGAGIILATGIESYGVAILAIKSHNLNFGVGLVNNVKSPNERSLGRELAKNVLASFGYHNRQVLMMLSDGLIKNASELIRGVQEILGKSFPFIGGTASDNFSFKTTYQYFQNQTLTNSAVALLWGGEMNFGLGSKHGWKPLGKPRIANETDGNLIKKIDNLPAISIYEDYFGKGIDELKRIKLSHLAILYPVGIYAEGEKEYILRNPIEVTEEGYLVCQGDVPQNSEIRLMMGNKEFCLQAAKDATSELMEALHGKEPKIVFIFESISRNRLFGRNASQEIEIVRETLGKATPIIGFYTYGETAPLKSLDYRGESYFHNQTITLLGIAN